MKTVANELTRVNIDDVAAYVQAMPGPLTRLRESGAGQGDSASALQIGEAA